LRKLRVLFLRGDHAADRLAGQPGAISTYLKAGRAVGTCPAFVTNSLIDGYVYKLDVAMPSKSEACLENYATCGSSVGFTYKGVAIGPRAIAGVGIPMVTIVWLKGRLLSAPPRHTGP